MKRILWALLVLTIAVPLTTAAAEMPGRTSRKVNDYARILERATEKELEKALRSAEKEYAVEIVVSTFKSLNGMTLDEFYEAYEQQWRKKWPLQDTGRIHILVFMDDRAARIAVDPRLLTVFPRDMSREILEKELQPRLRQRLYNEGVRSATLAAVEYLYISQI